MTRVLLFVDNFDQGGTQSQTLHLANELNRIGDVEVHVGSINGGGPLQQSLELPHDRVHHYPLHRYYSPGGVRQIARLTHDISRLRFHIVHSMDFYANVMCVVACGWRRTVKLVVSRRYEIRSHRLVHHYGEWWCYRLADAVVLNSARIAQRLVSSGHLPSDKAVVIPNGIDLTSFADTDAGERANPLHPTEPCRIGVVARLHPVKGHRTLFEAVARLVEKWRRLEVVLIGDGELRQNLMCEAERLRINDHLRFVGEQRDVRPWLARLDVAVLASDHEGFPNALLEYFAGGCAVVATDVGGIPDLATSGRDSLLVPAGDPVRLATAIDRLLSDVELRRALSRAAKARAQAYGMGVFVGGVRELHRRLLHPTEDSQAQPPVSTQPRSGPVCAG